MVYMDEDCDILDYLTEAKAILAESMSEILHLQHDMIHDTDEKIVPVNNVVELIDMGYDVAHSENLKKAESEFLRREQF